MRLDEMKVDLENLSHGEIEEIYKDAYPEHSANTRSAQLYSITRFVNLERGDKIIANNGKREILGVGEVDSGYYYEKDADTFKHRINVKWTDTGKRKIPDQSSWLSTLKVLKKGLFDDLVSYKEEDYKESETKCFSKEMFNWFKELHKNPYKKFYEETKFKFNQYVNTPFKDMIKRIASKLDPLMLVKLETVKRLRSNILKNDYGIGGAYDYYWFAFYPKGSSRIKDAQLYCCLNKDIVRYGFFIGVYGKDVKERFRKNIERYKEKFLSMVNSLENIPNICVYYNEDETSKEKNLELPIDNKLIDEWISKEEFGIGVTVNKEEAIRKGDLSEDIASLFKKLYPILLFTFEEDVVSEIEDESFESIEEVDEIEIYSKDTLLADTYLEEKDMERILNALENKKNIVLYGPPGTGKTFIARKIAKYIVEGYYDNIEYIQFHQSYAYEDFIEGLRPEAKENSDGNFIVHYPVKAGILKNLCENAIKRPQQKFVILIDEFNRGNISKIFGELLYLLEYRKESNTMKLPYSKTEFFIPDNLYIVATMNTADRSLTHLDFALRRRFSFIRCDVDTNILLKWGQEHSLILDSLTSILEDINTKIEDENYFIGISYFMRENLAEKIELIWRYEIYPYVEEYFINDDEKKVKDFTWENIKPKLQDLLS